MSELTQNLIPPSVLRLESNDTFNMDVDEIRRKYRTPAVDIVLEDEAFPKIKNLFKYVRYKNE